MTDEETRARGKGAGRRRQWLLFVSLALNLLVIGVIGGATITHYLSDRTPRRSAHGYERIVGMMGHSLEREDRRVIGRALHAQAGQGLSDRRQTARADYQQVIEALRTTPFDPAPLKAVLERQVAQASAHQRMGRRLLLERLTAMDEAERAAFADRLEKRMEQGGRRGHERGRTRVD